MKALAHQHSFAEQCDKVVEFNNPLETMQQTMRLFELPGQMAATYQTLSDLHRKIDSIQSFMSSFSEHIEVGDRYMSAKEASTYLGMSENTFNKYRYEAKVKIKGCKLDGKNWYKKSDLDRFMLTYEAKSLALG
jgi:hypothetical protein